MFEYRRRRSASFRRPSDQSSKPRSANPVPITSRLLSTRGLRNTTKAHQTSHGRGAAGCCIGSRHRNCEERWTGAAYEDWHTSRAPRCIPGSRGRLGEDGIRAWVCLHKPFVLAHLQAHNGVSIQERAPIRRTAGVAGSSHNRNQSRDGRVRGLISLPLYYRNWRMNGEKPADNMYSLDYHAICIMLLNCLSFLRKHLTPGRQLEGQGRRDQRHSRQVPCQGSSGNRGRAYAAGAAEELGAHCLCALAGRY
ncbi:hypothetical protein C8R47DRAFT_1131229 [Mycena vitilis]|nr:hypothetical protein C8R47DRAFT_1131229 [Mycena vitilis]